MATKYRLPEAPAGADIPNLQPDDLPKDLLLPATIVRGLNRGRVPLLCQHDGRHYYLPPGLFNCSYSAAQHFQQRLIVPGTRDPEVSTRTLSWIAIVGIDKPEDCQPFTAEQLKRFGEKTEGLAREDMISPTDRELKKVSMKSPAARSAVERGGAKSGRRKHLEAQGQANADAAAAAATTFKPPAQESAAEADERARNAER
jgi:hypothetical protein